MMEPLKQWKCDRCGQLIEKPEDGWFEWLTTEDNHVSEFRIVHDNQSSPLRHGGKGNCYFHYGKRGHSDTHLEFIASPDGFARVLAFLDPGEILDPDQERGCRVTDMRAFVEIMRRLYIPHYEEARPFMDAARRDGLIGGEPYSQQTLHAMIERYSGDEPS
jgi:hypothetical protein